MSMNVLICCRLSLGRRKASVMSMNVLIFVSMHAAAIFCRVLCVGSGPGPELMSGRNSGASEMLIYHRCVDTCMLDT